MHELLQHRRSITGSFIGSVAEMGEMLNFCAEKNILAEVEIIPIEEINHALTRMVNRDVFYRFVVDTQTIV